MNEDAISEFLLNIFDLVSITDSLNKLQGHFDFSELIAAVVQKLKEI